MLLNTTDIKNLPSIVKDVAAQWKIYNDGRVDQLSSWDEVRRYVYATDTRYTTSETSPWKNKTTRNKLARIRDILVTEYVRNLMPNDEFYRWKQHLFSEHKLPTGMTLRIEEYTRAKLRSQYVKFTEVVTDLLNDWVVYGNCAAQSDYIYKTKWTDDGAEELVFQGVRPFKIPINNIVFDPNAVSLLDTPIIVRTVKNRNMFMAEYKEEWHQETLKQIEKMDGMSAVDLQDWIKRNHQVQDGVNWLENFNKGQVELLTYHGDFYDLESKTFYRNHEIMVVDRAFLVYMKRNTASSGLKQVFYAGWRPRTDNLWHQGPLDNIIGLQYRIDHVENLKADVVDMMSMPVIVVKGSSIQERLIWRPGEQWDIPGEGDVDILYPDPKILEWNNEILTYERAMEELAGVPRETAGFRTPGEKTAFEVDQLMSNANGLFEEKLMAFESQILEPLLNQFLEDNLKHVTPAELQEIFPEKVLNPTSENVDLLRTMVAEGSLYVIGSKHYKERQRKVQELMNLLQLALGSEVTAQHISTFNLLKAVEREVGIEEEGIVTFGAAIEEQAGLQMKQQEVQQQLQEAQDENQQQPQG